MMRTKTILKRWNISDVGVSAPTSVIDRAILDRPPGAVANIAVRMSIWNTLLSTIAKSHQHSLWLADTNALAINPANMPPVS